MDFRLRTFDPSEHVRHLTEGAWQPLLDPHGQSLKGIDGKRGVRGTKLDGTAIGTDFIRMLPGARFAMHTHEGEHQIYFIQGKGYVHIAGDDIRVHAGAVIHIPAELPHAVWVPEHMRSPLIFAATGHPHHEVHAPDRMRLVEDD